LALLPIPVLSAAGPLPLANAGEPAAQLHTISEGSGSLAAGADAPGVQSPPGSLHTYHTIILFFGKRL